MKKWIVRIAREYSILIEAETPEKAMTIAENEDLDYMWDSDWTDMDVEEEVDYDTRREDTK